MAAFVLSQARNEERCSRTSFNLRTAPIVGEAAYLSRVKVGEELFFGGGRRSRVRDSRALFNEEDEPPFVGLLQVDAV